MRESGNSAARDREGIVRGRERPRGGRRGGGRGVITLATLTRRRPDSRSRSTRSTRSTRLRLTYTPTLGLPLHLPLAPSPPASHFTTPASSSSTSCLSSFSSSSFPARGLSRLFLRFFHRRARRGSSEFTPRSPNPKAPTPERPNVVASSVGGRFPTRCSSTI